MRICNGPECDRPARTNGLCDTHSQQNRTGRALAPIREYAREGEDLKLDDRPYSVQPDTRGAACADSDVEFVDIRTAAEAWAAQRICDRCPLAEACLEYARSTQEGGDPYPVTGVWGSVWFTSVQEIPMPELAPGVSRKRDRYRVSVNVGGVREEGGSFTDPDQANDWADGLREILHSEREAA